MKSNKALLNRIESAIDTIRPYLNADGGDVRIVRINEGNQLEIELLGACSTCSMSAMTMKAGVEEAVKKVIPEITSVIANNVPETSLTG